MAKKKSKKPSSCEGCNLFDASKMPSIPTQDVGILVVGGNPTKRDIKKGSFMGHSSETVRNMFNDYLSRMPRDNQPVVKYTYAAKCCAAETKEKVNADTIAQCSGNLTGDIQRLRPKVVLLLGADALRALGYTGKLDSYRGAIYDRKIFDHDCKVIASWHPSRLRKSPGLVATFNKDIGKCITIWSNTMDPMEMDIRTPLTFPDIMAQLDELDTFIEDYNAEKGRKPAIALDTETTGLEPWRESLRMIAISLAWNSNTKTGLAFPVDHRRSKLSLKERGLILERMEEILSEDRCVLTEHNAKYDEKVTRHAYGMDIPRAGWDTMLGEHLTDEDKKGVYSLKALTMDHFPGAGKYEAELHNHLKDIGIRRKERLKAAEKLYKTMLQKACVPYWESLTEDGRLSCISRWIEEGVLRTYSNKVIELEYRKPTKKQVKENIKPGLYKRSETLITKMFSNLPEEHMPDAVSRKVSQYKPNPKLRLEPTFEDIPMDIMLKYAAIDAIMTLLITKKQGEALGAEEYYILQLQKTRWNNRPLRNKRNISWGFYNISLPLSALLTDMEHKGVRMDREKIVRYRDYLSDKSEEVRSELMKEAGYEFNPGATADLCKLLYDDMGLPILGRTDTGAPSTDAAVLTDLYEEHSHPILKQLLMFRKLEKCKSTYLDSWLERSAYDGKLHASFNLNGTATYRLSSSSPSNRGLYRSDPVL